MIPKIRVFAKAGTKEFFGGGYDEDKMFYEISEIDYLYKTVTVWGCHNKDCGICDDTYKMEDVEIMQSTGLKDKNGKEIFDGDIVKLSWTVYDKEELFLIRTKPGHAPRIGNVTKGKELWLRHKNCEVVGNKFENIDLLEGMEWTN